tara:strand:+ start:4444 stop:4974 length:531 start_codon:yes stop_codon:yes gene_type:complete
MPPFTYNESYKHKYAKEIFKQWCDSTEWSCLEGDARCVSTNYNQKLYWRSNRSQNAWLEYPIVVNGNTNSIDFNWDEIWPGDNCDDDGTFWNGFVPTYTECTEYNLYPISVIDIVLPHKGSPLYFIEICHSNPVSNEKLEKLQQLMGNASLIEIDAEWILRQTGIPSELEIKRWLI